MEYGRSSCYSFTVSFLPETNKYAAKRQSCDGFRKEDYKSTCEVEAHLLGKCMMGAKGLLRAGENFLIHFAFGQFHAIHLLFFHSNNPLFSAAVKRRALKGKWDKKIIGAIMLKARSKDNAHNEPLHCGTKTWALWVIHRRLIILNCEGGKSTADIAVTNAPNLIKFLEGKPWEMWDQKH